MAIGAATPEKIPIGDTKIETIASYKGLTRCRSRIGPSTTPLRSLTVRQRLQTLIPLDEFQNRKVVRVGMADVAATRELEC